MELEELGKLLNQAANASAGLVGQVSVPDRKRSVVFADIKIRLRWILWIFGGTTLIFLPLMISHRKTDLLLLILYMILSIESVISVIALIKIRTIEKTTGNIRLNLVHRIQALNMIFRSYIFLNVFLYILMAALLEYSMHFSSNIYHSAFAGVPFPARLTIYMAFIAFQYFTKRKSFEKHYGDYLRRMTKILGQTNEKE